MDWRIAAIGPMFMWALYVVFGSLANRAHGEKVSMAFEAGAMMLVSGAVLLFSGFSDFRRMTSISATHAAIMGLMSALGVLLQFYAFRVAPADQQGTVGMFGGLYPVIAMIIFYGMYSAGIQGGSSVSPRQWLGVACGAIALWLVGSK